jgi:transposase
MVGRPAGADKPPTKQTWSVWFAPPPWDEEHPERRAIEERLPQDHVARRIDEGVDLLDLRPLIQTYQGRGTPPLPPAVLLKIVLYELTCGRPSPAQWFRDARECDSLRWLARGAEPSRTACYDFWRRVQPFFTAWNEQVLHAAVQQGYTSASRAAQDGTAVAACASRHRLVNQETLLRRLGELDQALAADQSGQPLPECRGWMARHADTRLAQRTRYERARQRMDQLQAENQQRRKCHRQRPEKIVVSVSDPEAACSRDKLRVFRPLYNVQFLRDLDSPFVLAYEVFAQVNDSGTVAPLVEQCVLLTGHKPRILLADAGYAAVLDLAVCEVHGITLYAPVSQNDFSAAQQRKHQTNQFTLLPKAAFTWSAAEATYLCPQGHRLHREGQSFVHRQGHERLRTFRFRCPPKHCLGCPQATTCTPNPADGRSVTRLEHEELLDALRDRMSTPEAKTLYRLRARTVELAFADVKEHRSLHRFNARGLAAATAHIGALVLAHNLLALLHFQNNHRVTHPASRKLEKMRC